MKIGETWKYKKDISSVIITDCKIISHLRGDKVVIKNLHVYSHLCVENHNGDDEIWPYDVFIKIFESDYSF